MAPSDRRRACTSAWLSPFACKPSTSSAKHSAKQPRRPSLIRRALSVLQKRSRISRRSEENLDPPRPSREEWRELILEFEQRADDKYAASSTPPPPGRIGRVNPAQFESFPYVSCAAMAALTTLLWWMGRMLRLDAFVMLFYPLPTMYAAARFGLQYSDLTLICSIFLIFTILGPIYAGFFFLNTGLLTITYSRVLWYNMGWKVALFAGGIAKGIGLALQLAWVSVILRYNAWKAAALQVTLMLRFFGNVINKIAGKAICGEPGVKAVQGGLSVIVALHSFYHVLFTLIVIAILLKKVEHELVRKPPEVPGLRWMLKKATPRENGYR